MFSFPEVAYEREPFPHCVVEGAWSPEVLGWVKWECGTIRWDHTKNESRTAHKSSCSSWDKFPEMTNKVIRFCSSPLFLEWLEKTTGEKGLIADPYLFGGGVHRVGPGGFLNMHTDFTFHQKLGLYRKLNLLLYLNEGWRDEWGGSLELNGPERNGIRLMSTVPPRMNTMVVFTTDDNSWHGHPGRVECPEGIYRDSIALYYYGAEPEGRSKRLTTNYDA